MELIDLECHKLIKKKFDLTSLYDFYHKYSTSGKFSKLKKMQHR